MKTRLFFLIVLLGTTFNGATEALSLHAEIQRLEKQAQSNAGADKYKTFVELGQLLQLAGEWERAAQVWLNAASLDPAAGTEPVFKAATCFIALGDMNKALSALQSITGTGALVQGRVRYLKAYSETAQYKNTKSFELLLSDPQCVAYRPALYYLLGKLSGITGYFTKLLEEYPRSPEARILKGKQVQPAYTALWFFYPGWEGVTVAESVEKPGILQVGLFEHENNARLMVLRLSEAGFAAATVIQRTINKKEYWAVGVPPGLDANKTITALKAAGFEAFLVNLQAAP
ncbi:MAG: hypothetical protein LBO67_05875 [Spirochaetaceae bacterium]|jgi:tetratricopeptide (TPR) repeat protein|nr:hypothetical protein [Spirochaetaceae bacterium]